jgi:hypothetical protein
MQQSTLVPEPRKLSIVLGQNAANAVVVGSEAFDRHPVHA